MSARTKTVHREFIVRDLSGELVLLEVADGEKAGMKVLVPKTSKYYEGELQNDLEKLAEDDVIMAKLKTTGKRNLAWLISELED